MIVGAFAAIVCSERRADAQNYPWCADGNYKGGPRLWLPQKLRQLGDIRCDPARFIARRLK
jgi:hypothetical protein